ncbi:MAG: NAD(P)-dependent oxidoreductase [Candidatus Omnitrophica bacterium]|nr:NAD(P)-dependent oxidoreductase [Candidatus Omnitrophota bacterium]
MKTAKILVTGANGFVGQALYRRLMALGYHVFGLDRINSSMSKGFVKFYCIDITAPFKIDEEFDFVFHLAAHNVTHVGSQETDLYHAVNVKGTENVLNAVKAAHFIFLSTTKIYKAEGKTLDERSPLLPAQEYEKSKLAAENLCREMCDAEKLLILRSVNIVGKGQPDKAILPVLFKKAMAGETLEIFGPRGLVLQLLYVQDVVDAFVKVIEKENLHGIYNLASLEHIRLDELAEKIKKMAQSTSEIRFSNESAVIFCEVNAIKAQNALDWQAKTKIQQILAEYC